MVSWYRPKRAGLKGSASPNSSTLADVALPSKKEKRISSHLFPVKNGHAKRNNHVNFQCENPKHTTWRCISEAGPQLVLDPSNLGNIVAWGLCWTIQHVLLWKGRARREGCNTGTFAMEFFHCKAIKFLRKTSSTHLTRAKAKLEDQLPKHTIFDRYPNKSFMWPHLPIAKSMSSDTSGRCRFRDWQNPRTTKWSILLLPSFRRGCGMFDKTQKLSCF